MKVMTLDRDALAQASKKLIDQVLASSFRPTHLIAIADGGVPVAREMASHVALEASLMVIPARRPSSDRKRSLRATTLLHRLPYFVTDRLRVFEAQLLDRMRKPAMPDLLAPLPSNVSEILSNIRSATQVRLLVVDDAVDSGRTLWRIVNALRCVQEAGGEIRTAAITVTRSHALIRPDFHVYSGVLCRFPWSYDFRP